MNKYELMYIINPTLEEKDIKENAETLKKVVESQKGKVLEFKEMGQRELAYEIKKHKNGYYYLLTFEAKPEVINEINHVANVNENILRYLVIKVED
ncbi:MAG TPA: 30S ribosomal protein S6 [Bacilli bacterium]|nr:30S ribosomal protein S6 [Bacilli bacterium]